MILETTKTIENRTIQLIGKDIKNLPLIIGVVHGDEPQGEILINEYLKQNKDFDLLFIPSLNPDGLAKNTRQNANKVDLNRNFPTKNWELVDNPDFFGGLSPQSEIETKFLIKVLEKYEPSIILTLHAPFCTVNFDGAALKYAQAISEIINYPVQEDIGYPTPGSFGTYAGIEKKIPTITLELDENVNIEDLIQPVHKIFEYLKTCMV